jgi:hypothetical protein
MVMLVVALPLQGQAAALMTCHSPVAMESSAVQKQPPTAAVIEHSPHHGQLGHSAPHSQHLQADSPVLGDHSDQTQTGVTTTASCALCSAFCTMATGLPQTVLQHTLDFRPPPLPQATPSVYVGVVLDGLLRPPRA